MADITFTTMFGGSAMSVEYVHTLDGIEDQLKGIYCPYNLDLNLTIGADLITVTHPTGLRSPRVKLDQKRVTGTIFMNSQDVIANTDPATFLKSTIYASLDDIFKRIAKKDPEVSYEVEIQKVRFLLD